MENTQKAIGAAFDSVDLINNLITKPVNEKNTSAIKRNVKHLELMMSKEEFYNALSEVQKTQIQNCIGAGNNHIGE